MDGQIRLERGVGEAERRVLDQLGDTTTSIGHLSHLLVLHDVDGEGDVLLDEHLLQQPQTPRTSRDVEHVALHLVAGSRGVVERRHLIRQHVGDGAAIHLGTVREGQLLQVVEEAVVVVDHLVLSFLDHDRSGDILTLIGDDRDRLPIIVLDLLDLGDRVVLDPPTGEHDLVQIAGGLSVHPAVVVELDLHHGSLLPFQLMVTHQVWLPIPHDPTPIREEWSFVVSCCAEGSRASPCPPRTRPCHP